MAGSIHRQARMGKAASWLIRHRSLSLGGALVGGLVLASLLAPALTSGSPLIQDLYHPFEGVSPQHPFGTDAFGRDIATRILYGARYSLLEAAASTAISCSLGTLLGLAAGAAGRRVDQAIMGLMDILFAFPGVVLALLIVSLLGPGLFNMLLAISLFSVPVFARLARNLSMALRQADFVEAAVAMGAGFPRIVLVHILPNAAGPILVQCAISAGSVILMAASLSFLGLGVQPPAPEWGAMMSDGRNYVGAYVLPSLFPGLAITLAALGFNLLGEGIRGLLGRG
jgi:ABC-type dipeptide/oligopeptide/nickel transport system permease subunit